MLFNCQRLHSIYGSITASESSDLQETNLSNLTFVKNVIVVSVKILDPQIVICYEMLLPVQSKYYSMLSVILSLQQYWRNISMRLSTLDSLSNAVVQLSILLRYVGEIMWNK